MNVYFRKDSNGFSGEELRDHKEKNHKSQQETLQVYRHTCYLGYATKAHHPYPWPMWVKVCYVILCKTTQSYFKENQIYSILNSQVGWIDLFIYVRKHYWIFLWLNLYYRLKHAFNLIITSPISHNAKRKQNEVKIVRITTWWTPLKDDVIVKWVSTITPIPLPEKIIDQLRTTALRWYKYIKAHSLQSHLSFQKMHLIQNLVLSS